MGLVDQARLAGSERALEIADDFASWFDGWSGKFTREQFDDILDAETGGMLEVWADLLALTGKEKYRRLLARYDRPRLFEPLLQGRDPLTNMHANTTIPEVLGCARAYEVTGEKRWLDIVTAYWKCAVTDRGMYATGGQTQGEIWTPPQKLKARLGDKNQEHCTVYNMMRLAEFLFRQTGDPAYLQYMEYNFHNGVMAQTYWRGASESGNPDRGLLTYFLPLKAGLRKGWAGARDSFFCCHGTMVQANSALGRYLCYQEVKRIIIAQYLNADIALTVGKTPFTLALRQDEMNGWSQNSSVNNGAHAIENMVPVPHSKPDFRKYDITVHTAESVNFTLLLRLPAWITAPATVCINGEQAAHTDDCRKFVPLQRTWKDGDVVTLLLPIGLQFIALPDDAAVGAFRYGPDVLAGITPQERVLTLAGSDPTVELEPDCERQWGTFQTFYHTCSQDPGLDFIKLNSVGYQPYQVYFRVCAGDKK